MMHELKKMVQDYRLAAAQNLKSVMATVVALEGSSYRRPGVRMLIREDGKMTGAVSGGCVEKEVLRQAQSVFEDGIPKVMTYDGRYRLGCEGILYILIEAFMPSDALIEAFEKNLKIRKNIAIKSFFKKEVIKDLTMGSAITFADNKSFSFSAKTSVELQPDQEVFQQVLKPCYSLIIFGAEHDSVQLATLANLTGWEVTIVAPVDDPRNLENFPGAQKIEHLLPEQAASLPVDQQTALILMNHSYVKDLKFLIALKDTRPSYIGLLGPMKRREKLLSEFMEFVPDPDPDFFDLIHGPAGLNIGAETPQEIAISVISEILTVIRNQEPYSLKVKRTGIHSD
jgi:xanthine dehydrogenase accessory factor